MPVAGRRNPQTGPFSLESRRRRHAHCRRSKQREGRAPTPRRRTPRRPRGPLACPGGAPGPSLSLLGP
eukprot:5234440-Pyramimonas_sp.AAC.1